MNALRQPDTSIDWLALRAEFPVLAREVHGKPLVYLDNANTGQKPRAVIEAMDAYYSRYAANVARAVHSLGEEATAAYEGARGGDLLRGARLRPHRRRPPPHRARPHRRGARGGDRDGPAGGGGGAGGRGLRQRPRLLHRRALRRRRRATWTSRRLRRQARRLRPRPRRHRPRRVRCSSHKSPVSRLQWIRSRA